MFIFSLAFTRTGTLGILGSTESSFIQVWSHFSCPEKPDQSLLRIVQRNKEAFQGPSLYIRICSKRDFFFLRKSITNLGGQATQSASWISLYFVSTLHMTMKGCDILTGSRLHQAVHNELENNKIQMLSQVNTSLLSKVNQIRRILLQVFFFASIIILCEGIFLFAGTSVFFQHSKTSGALFLRLWYWKPNSQENVSLTWMTLICL